MSINLTSVPLLKVPKFQNARGKANAFYMVIRMLSNKRSVDVAVRGLLHRQPGFKWVMVDKYS